MLPPFVSLCCPAIAKRVTCAPLFCRERVKHFSNEAPCNEGPKRDERSARGDFFVSEHRSIQSMFLRLVRTHTHTHIHAACDRLLIQMLIDISIISFSFRSHARYFKKRERLEPLLLWICCWIYFANKDFVLSLYYQIINVIDQISNGMSH